MATPKMTMLAVAATLGSAVDVAFTLAVTAPTGAVYVVATPLAVCAGLNVPHTPIGLHDQSTPAFDESFANTAVIELGWLTLNEVGGAGLNEIEGTVMVVLP
jgi:hypothetical protein